MNIEQHIWGITSEGEAVIIYTLENENGVKVQLSNIGAGIVSAWAPDREGRLANVVLGYKDFSSYFGDGACMGKTPGRYANRIAKGRFTLDGKEYTLPINNGVNHLHGGPNGFANRLWESGVEGNTVVFTLESEGGDAGYPAALYAEVAYTLTEDNELRIILSAQSNGKTVLNLTNHAYFNMKGESAGSVLDNVLKVYATRFLAKDQTAIPTGEMVPVAGGPMDFTQPKALGRDINQQDRELIESKGYDHCWVLDDWSEDVLRLAAELTDPESGRCLEVLTTQPGIQVYTGNYLTGSPMSISGGAYKDYDGVALECQDFPDAPNHPEFPSTVLDKGEDYSRMIVYRFSTR